MKTSHTATGVGPDPVSRAEKISVSIPRDLYEWAERERDVLGMNRSEFVAYVLQRHQDEIEHERRLARYAVAYAKIPETPAESALGELFLTSMQE